MFIDLIVVHHGNHSLLTAQSRLGAIALDRLGMPEDVTLEVHAALSTACMLRGLGLNIEHHISH